MITYKIISPRTLKPYQAWLLELLRSEWNTPEGLLRSLKNSTNTIIALDGEKVVWSFQIITDKYFTSFLVNLWVDPAYRNAGIGGKLTELAIEQAKKIWVKWVQLIPDSSHPWLKDFYAKHGFKEGIYMYTRG